jgi:hypothetical protein
MTSRVRGTLILSAATLAVVAAVVAGIVVLGSPAAERRLRMDQTRLGDLQTIERLVSSYSRVHRALPETIGALASEPGYSVPSNDPESRTPYVYRRLTPNSFEICAAFSTDSAAASATNSYALAFNAEWAHGKGMHCFERHVKPPEQ